MALLILHEREKLDFKTINSKKFIFTDETLIFIYYYRYYENIKPSSLFKWLYFLSIISSSNTAVHAKWLFLQENKYYQNSLIVQIQSVVG